MTFPVRLQLSRRKGFNLQEHSRAVNGLPAVNCSRPGIWGNRWRIGDQDDFISDDGTVSDSFQIMSVADAIAAYRRDLERLERQCVGRFEPLRCTNLACWCHLCPKHAENGKPLDEPCPDCSDCHVDVLGPRANLPICEEVASIQTLKPRKS
jgi:hypothetical protein